MKKFITKSPEETKQLAKSIAKKTAGGVIALSGDLGAGKTTFVQGFAQGLGIKEKIISPTFVLIRQYSLNEKVFYHIDLYRLEDFQNLGLQEILENPNNIILIEWAEKLRYLPQKTKKISIEKLEDNKRLITID